VPDGGKHFGGQQFDGAQRLGLPEPSMADLREEPVMA
jgi:hypothetical protein